jgi:hypothetical protein
MPPIHRFFHGRDKAFSFPVDKKGYNLHDEKASAFPEGEAKGSFF